MKRVFKLWMMLLWMISAFFCQSFAQNLWEEDSLLLISSRQHPFKITFNQALRQDSVNRDNLYIINEAYQKVPIDLQLLSPNTVQLIPQNLYVPGDSYTIVLTRHLRSEKNSTLSKEMRVRFTTNLALTLEEAKNIESSAISGTKIGQYPAKKKQKFWEKIQEASLVLAKRPSLQQEREAIKTLQMAIKEFQQSKILSEFGRLQTPSAPLFNEKGIVTVQAVPEAQSYELRLYKEKSVMATAVIRKENLSYSFAKEIRRFGFGKYSVTVKALGDRIEADSKESAPSITMQSSKLSVPVHLKWSGQRISWEEVPFAESYDVRLIKNGSPSGIFANSKRPFYDFNQDIEYKLKSGVYTAQVRALSGLESIYADGDYSNESERLLRHSQFLRVRMSSDAKTITLDFDDDILLHPQGLAQMKRQIEIAKGNANFSVLAAEDLLSVGGNRLQITLKTPLNEPSRIRIKSNTLRDNSYQLIAHEIITPTFSKQMQSPPEVTIEGGNSANNRDGHFTLKSSKNGELYLLHESVSTVSAAISIAKTEKKAVSVFTGANTAQQISTATLLPGIYYAYALDTEGIFSQPSARLTVTDGIAPTVTALDQSVKNIDGENFEVHLSEEGVLYLIHEAAYQRTDEKLIPSTDELDTAIAANKAKKHIVRAEDVNKSLLISSKDLVPGVYHLFAVDEAINWTKKSSAILTVRDGISPVVTFNPMSTVLENIEGNTTTAQSNELGYLYLVLRGEPANRMEDLERAVQKNSDTLLRKGSKAVATEENRSITLSAEALTPGTYYVYAVDQEGNLSEKSTNSLTISDETPPRVMAAVQTVGNREGDFVLAMSSEGTGALYMIRKDQVLTTIKDHLEETAYRDKGMKVVVKKAYSDIQLFTEGLSVGKYDLYAEDQSGNISEKLPEKIEIKN